MSELFYYFRIFHILFFKYAMPLPLKHTYVFVKCKYKCFNINVNLSTYDRAAKIS